MDIFLWITTSILLSISLLKNKTKTIAAFKIAFNKVVSILPLFILVMISFSLVITYIPAEIIQKYIGAESGINGIILSLLFGSVSIMPGFAAFPLCAALKTEGVPFYIIAAFSLSLMNVGIVTFPIEKKFLGLRVALMRNIAALFICIIVVVFVKLIFGA